MNVEKRHFEMIAASFRDTLNEGYDLHPKAREALSLAAGYIADGCKADNPRFDRSRFLKACGFDA
jgi:hypothetical protein